MVELLVVIGIIGLLTTILVVALGPTLQSGRIAATRTTINQLNDIIQARMEAIYREDLSGEAKLLMVNVSSLNANNPKHVAAVEFLLKKNLARQAHPQRLRDLWGFNGNREITTDNSPHWADWLAEFGLSPNPEELPWTTNSPETNAQLLLFAVTRIKRVRATEGGKSIVLPTIDADSLNPNHIRNSSDHTTAAPRPRLLVDEWDSPLRFYLWPTQVAGNSAARQSLMATLQTNDMVLDPDDPFPVHIGTDGPVYHAQFWASGGSLSNRGTPFGIQSFSQANYHDPNIYHSPLIVSAGPDGELGLGEPTAGAPARLGQVTNLDAIFDNITNRQR